MPPARRAQRSRLDTLTARELEVLEVMVTGARDRDIAKRLGITLGTVKVHLHHVYTKLGVGNRVEATRHYLEQQYSRQERGAARGAR